MVESLKIGDIFDDKYELVAQLGSGGLGTVYKAVQIDCARLVALKVLHLQEEMDDEFIARFKREGQILSQLAHPNVVTVYHIGFSESSGAPYLVMELVEGESLRRILNHCDRFPVGRALKIARDLARALAYVHEHGIIHRDLKPENILLANSPDPDTVKIIDFGLARQTAPTEASLTKSGLLLGTTDYMSPEQCQGQRATTASDIYSLSVLLFEMLSGSRAYTADTPFGVLFKHVNDPVPELGKEFHPDLNKNVGRGMAKKQDDRFKSMEEYAEKLDSLLDLLESESPADRKLRILLPALGALVLFAVLLCAVFVLPSYFAAPNKIQAILSSTEQDAKILFLKDERALVAEGRVHDAQELYEKYLNSTRFTNLADKERLQVFKECFLIYKGKNLEFTTQIALNAIKEIFSIVKAEVKHGKVDLAVEYHTAFAEYCDFLLGQEMSNRTWTKILTLFSDRVAIPKKNTEQFDYGVYKSTKDSSNEVMGLFRRPLGSPWALRAEAALHLPGYTSDDKALKKFYWLVYASEDAALEKKYDRLHKYVRLADALAKERGFREHAYKLNAYLAMSYLLKGEEGKAREAIRKAKASPTTGRTVNAEATLADMEDMLANMEIVLKEKEQGRKNDNQRERSVAPGK